MAKKETYRVEDLIASSIKEIRQLEPPGSIIQDAPHFQKGITLALLAIAMGLNKVDAIEIERKP